MLRPAKVKRIVVLPKGWIVKRMFGWLGRYRRHSRDYERNVGREQFVKLYGGWESKTRQRDGEQS